jgi:ribosomal protein L11 methyltransferase
MEQIEITFRLTGTDPVSRDLLPYWLEAIGFEGFVENPQGIAAYIPAQLFDQKVLIDFLQSHHLIADCFNIKLLPDKNWNEEWEKNFEPVVIQDQCRIRAPFHKADNAFPLEIIIEPKMSFGTGHHATTTLMIKELLKNTP